MKGSTLVLLLLIPILLEATGISIFLISIPGIPLSLGGIGLILFGIIKIVSQRISFNYSFIGFLLIYVGALLGSLFSENFFENFSAATAQLLFALSCYFVALEMSRGNKIVFQLIEICMVLTYFHWLIYILNYTLYANDIESYSSKYYSNLYDGIINHHVPGFFISVSAFYLGARLMNFYKIISFIIIGLALVLCILIESRSNTLICIVALFWLFSTLYKFGMRQILTLIFVGGFAYMTFLYLLNQYSFLNHRFDLQDTEYQSATNESRLLLYQNFISNFVEYPLGRGLDKPRILINSSYISLHNQYLTWAIAGGFLAIVGIFVLLRAFYFIIFYKYFLASNSDIFKYILPLKAAIFVLFATLLTIDFGGAVFSLGMVMFMFLEIERTLQMKKIRFNQKYNKLANHYS
jgi:hypothetical protein